MYVVQAQGSTGPPRLPNRTDAQPHFINPRPTAWPIVIARAGDLGLLKCDSTSAQFDGPGGLFWAWTIYIQSMPVQEYGPRFSESKNPILTNTLQVFQTQHWPGSPVCHRSRPQPWVRQPNGHDHSSQNSCSSLPPVNCLMLAVSVTTVTNYY